MLGGKNKQQHRPLGYTIVEVMIVLAVSGMMFLVAANFINGKQEKASFTEGSNDTVSILQNIVEDISDGHYSDVPISCVPAGDGSNLVINPSAADIQGQNSGCVFLGKIIRFSAPGAPAAPNSSRYSTFSIAASRSITSLPNNLVGAVSSLTTDSAMPQSLTVTSMTITDALGSPPPVSPNNVYNIGFAQGLGTTEGPGTYDSGAQPVQLIYYDSTDSPDAHAGMAIRPAKSATICLSDGTQNAIIFVGGKNDNQLSITVQRLGTTACP